MHLVNDLTINLSEKNEYIEIGSKNHIDLNSNGISTKNLLPLGSYYLMILNNSQAIINILKNSINHFEDDTDPSTYSLECEINKLEYELNVIDKKLSGFISGYLMTFLRQKEMRFNDLKEEMYQLEKNINNFNEMLSCEETLNNHFDSFSSFLDNIIIMDVENDKISSQNNSEFFDNLIPTSYEEKKKQIEQQLNAELIIQELTEKELKELSPKEIKKALINEISNNFIHELEIHIEKINYIYNLKTIELTANQFNFLYESTVVLPKNTRYFCYNENDYIKSFKSIYEKIITSKEQNKSDSFFKLIDNLQPPIIFNSYEITNLNHLLNVYQTYLFDRNINICKCENCNKYFIPNSRSDEKYCNNIFKNNMTCKEYAPKNKYRKSINNDKIKKAHYNLSQNFRMKITRSKTLQKKEEVSKLFEKYKSEYEKQKYNYDNKSITEIEFLDWIIQQKNLINNKGGVKNGSTRNNKK